MENTSQSNEAQNLENTTLAKDLFVRQLFDFVSLSNKTILLPKVLFVGVWDVYKIEVKDVSIRLPKYFSQDEWNNYCDEIQINAGCKASSYCEWVKDDDYNTIGTIVLFNNEGEHIRLKHFRQWKNLSRYVSKIFR